MSTKKKVTAKKPAPKKWADIKRGYRSRVLNELRAARREALNEARNEKAFGSPDELFWRNDAEAFAAAIEHLKGK